MQFGDCPVGNMSHLTHFSRSLFIAGRKGPQRSSIAWICLCWLLESPMYTYAADIGVSWPLSTALQFLSQLHKLAPLLIQCCKCNASLITEMYLDTSKTLKICSSISQQTINTLAFRATSTAMSFGSRNPQAMIKNMQILAMLLIQWPRL